MDVSLITEETYKEYVTISRIYENSETNEEISHDCFSDSGNNNKSYFSVPEFLSDKKTLLISPVNKIDKQEWLPSGSKIRVTISESLGDKNSVPMLNKYSFAFTLGTEGDAEGPIITNENTKLSIVSSEKDITQSEWGDFEPSKNALADHTYADSIHVGAGEKFIAKIQASDFSTGDTGIKEFVADVRLMYIYEGGRLPNSSEKALKNLILFDKDGNWLYESGFLKQDFYKEYSLPYSGSNKLAETETDFIFDFEDFKTDEISGALPVDGIYRIALTAKDSLDNYSTNPNIYYVVRDTTPPDAEKNAENISFTDDCGVEVDGKRYFGYNYNSIKLKMIQSIIDSGTRGQPWTADKTMSYKWSVALSDSNIVSPTENWSAFVNSNEIHTIYISEKDLSSGISNFFVWVKYQDSFNNISEAIVFSKAINIDVIKPEISIVKGSDDEQFIYQKRTDSNDIIYTKNTYTNIKIETEPDFSGSLYFGEFGGELLPLDCGKNAEEISITQGKSYVIKCIDQVQNESVLNFDVETAESLASVTINNANIVDSDFDGLSLSYYYNFDSQKSEYISNIGNYTNGDIKLSFDISENLYGLKDNGIIIEDVFIYEYTIKDTKSGNLIYKQKLNKKDGIIPLKREVSSGDISFEIIAEIDY